ncbi:unnamed protein product [Caenorhabditis nigoni]
MNENSTTSINDLEMVDTRLTDDAKRIANQPGLIEPASSKLGEKISNSREIRPNLEALEPWNIFISNEPPENELTFRKT